MRSHPAKYGDGFEAALGLPRNSLAVPSRTTMARPLMPRQPYSVAVPSDEEERFPPSSLRVRGSG